jgi:hypothetical protein
MAIETTGAEFKRFYDDTEVWGTENDGSVYCDDEVITVNGVDHTEGVYTEDVPDDARVTLTGGYIYGLGDRPLSFELVFKRWKKGQETASMVVECDIGLLDAVVAAVKSAGGRVVE